MASDVPMSNFDTMLTELLDVDTTNAGTAGLVLTSLGGTAGFNFQAGGGGALPAGALNDVQMNDGAGNFKVSAAGLNVDAAGLMTSGAGINCTAGNIDNLNGKMESRTFIPSPPIAFDTPLYPANTTGDYKLKLQVGVNNAAAVAPFDLQNPMSAALLGYPTGQVMDWTNNLPVGDKNSRIIGRIATGVAVAPGANYRLQNFGSASAGNDRMIYDPANMRTRQIGTGWYYAGTPSIYRVVGTLGGMIVRVYLDALWVGPADPLNKAIIYVHQYRSGALLRSFILGCDRSQSGECIISGYRSLLGWSGSFGEDWDVMTDDLDCEVINQSPVAGSNLQINLGQVEYEFRLSS